MAQVFNPPPNWPQPPRGWQPEADWRPDPAWGPAPEGWQLWIDPDAPSQQSQSAAPKEKSIFISYRRSDCQPQANAINDGLRHRLAPARVFMDIDSIPAGVDFEQHIREEIEICDVVLVLIGDDWLSSTDDDGNRRIDNPDDFVRLEIETALTSPRVSMIPILVENAEMPRGSELPESLRNLARINAFELSDLRWTSDIERLAVAIRDLEAVQEARAKRLQAAQPQVGAVGIAAPEASQETPTMRLADETPVAPPVQTYGPPHPHPPVTPYPGATGPKQSQLTLGWVMVAIPIVCCGILSFVPSLWVASERRANKRLMTRSLVIAAAFIAVEIVAFVLIGTAPKDAEGSMVGVAGNIGAGLMIGCALAAAALAFVQRQPADALTDSA